MNIEWKDNMHSNRFYYQITKQYVENMIGGWIDCDEDRVMEVEIEYYQENGYV